VSRPADFTVRSIAFYSKLRYNGIMKQNIADILKEALKLPPEARAALAGTLLDSLDDTVDRDAESAWEAEILLRLKEIDEGKVKLMPWSEARTKISGQ
jgi:putative addiction module component (TIGR02574 family)